MRFLVFLKIAGAIISTLICWSVLTTRACSRDLRDDTAWPRRGCTPAVWSRKSIVTSAPTTEVSTTWDWSTCSDPRERHAKWMTTLIRTGRARPSIQTGKIDPACKRRFRGSNVEVAKWRMFVHCKATWLCAMQNASTGGGIVFKIKCQCSSQAALHVCVCGTWSAGNLCLLTWQPASTPRTASPS